jgi:hypothetical protein
MGKLFWLVSAVGLVVAVGLWGYGAFVVGEDLAKASKKVNREKNGLRNMAKNARTIRNRRWLAYADERLEVAKKEEATLKELMRSREMDMKWLGAWPTTVADFRTWISPKYDERNGMLREAGIKIPNQPTLMGDAVAWEAAKVNDLPGIVRRYVQTAEIARALSEARTEITYTYTDSGQRRTANETRTVDALDSISFPTLPLPRRPNAAEKESEPPPFAEERVVVRFVAHYSVALDVMQRLEKSDKCLFVIRGASVRQNDKTLNAQVIRDENERRVYMDTNTHEPPVEVTLSLSLLSFPAAAVAK